MARLGVPLLAALIGGAIVAFALLVIADVDGGGEPVTVVRQAPLQQRGDDGEGLTPADIYERDASGVVFVRAVVVRETRSPFDLFPRAERGESTGTGFVIDEEGSILTNAHVVEGAQRVTVQFADERTAPARVVGTDTSTDVALLRAEARDLDLRPLELGTSSDVRVGDPTVAIGNPFGLERTLTTGVVSALQRRIEAPDGIAIEGVLQTDAALNPGNSGGPLIDAAGRVIGINSAIRTGAPGVEGSIGIGFAVPIDTAKRILPELRETGRVERGTLDVRTIAIGGRLVVQAVQPGGRAERAGVRPGDTIARVAGREVSSAADVLSAVGDRRPGDTVRLELIGPDGDRREADVELVERGEARG